MAKFSAPYRLAALALAIGFLLGAVQPGVCHGRSGEATSEGHDHPEKFCTAPCHLAKAPTENASGLVLESRRAVGKAAGLPPAAAHAGRSGPAFWPRVAASSTGRPARQGSVRLHVFCAVFLN